ncbi:hypothetical protein QTP88_005002 [Uroleucon formosanum]
MQMQTQQPPINSTFKFIERRKNEWRCLLCCHVRTGTIFLGLWHLMLQLLAISTLGVFLRHPEFLRPVQITRTSIDHNELPTALADRNIPTFNVNYVSTDGSSALSNYDQDDIIEPTIGGTKGEKYSSFGMFMGRPLQMDDINYGVFVIFFTLIITISMIYGAIKGKPKMLIPFFCMQLLDLFVTILSAFGYLCYLPDFHRLMIRTESEYMSNGITSINPRFISFIVIFSLFVSIISKGYFVGVVWSCYKYLTLKRSSAQPTIHYIESNFVVQNLLRPDYDFNMKKFPPPPPSYAVAVGEDNATYPDVPPPSYNATH